MKRNLTVCLSILLIIVFAGITAAQRPPRAGKGFQRSSKISEYERANAGYDYVRELIGLGHQDCAKKMMHLAYQATERVDFSDDGMPKKVADLQMDIIDAALDNKDFKSANLFIERCRSKTIVRIRDDKTRKAMSGRLDKLEGRSKPVQKVK